MQVQPALGGEGAGHLAGRVAVVADARARGRGRRPGSRARGGCPTRPASPCRPTRPRARGRPGASMSKSLMALATWSRHSCRKCSRAEVGVVPPHVDDRRPLAHGALHAAPPEMTGRISTMSASSSSASPGTSVSPGSRAPTRGSGRGGRGARAPASGPSTSSSRRGLRSSTCTAPQPWRLRGVRDHERLARAQLLAQRRPRRGPARRWYRRSRKAAKATAVQSRVGPGRRRRSGQPLEDA